MTWWVFVLLKYQSSFPLDPQKYVKLQVQVYAQQYIVNLWDRTMMELRNLIICDSLAKVAIEILTNENLVFVV